MKKLTVGKKIYSSANRYRYPLRNKSLNSSFPEKDLAENSEKDEKKKLKDKSCGKNEKENKELSVKNKTLDDIQVDCKSLGKGRGIIRRKKLFKTLDSSSLTSEIKDTVNCYICFGKLNVPRMCPFCHRMACEDCLKTWFLEENKKKCAYCKELTSLDKMIPVPFMDSVAEFIDAVLEQKKQIEKIEEEEINSYISKTRENVEDLNDIEEQILDEENDSEGEDYHNFLFGDGENYCSRHKKERLYYYCIDCEKAYCRTCFVFFGDEKDKHVSHRILEYRVYRKVRMGSLLQEKGKICGKIEEIEKHIEKSKGYRNVYVYQKNMYNAQIEGLKQKVNKIMDESISNIDNFIGKLNNIIIDLRQGEDKINHYIDDCIKINSENYANYKDTLKFNNELYQKLIMMNSHIYISNKDIDKLISNTQTIHFECYQTKIGEFDHDNIFFNKNLKFGNSPFELLVDNKDKKGVGISVFIPKKLNIQHKHSISGFFSLTKMGESPIIYMLNSHIDNNILHRKFNKWKYVTSNNYSSRNNKNSISVNNSISLDKENCSSISNVNTEIPLLNESDSEDNFSSTVNIDKSNFYENDNECILSKKIEWDTFGESKFKIKAVICDFYID